MKELVVRNVQCYPPLYILWFGHSEFLQQKQWRTHTLNCMWKYVQFVFICNRKWSYVIWCVFARAEDISGVKRVKLFHKSFLQQLIMRMGVAHFVEEYSQPLVIAVCSTAVSVQARPDIQLQGKVEPSLRLSHMYYLKHMYLHVYTCTCIDRCIYIYTCITCEQNIYIWRVT